MQSALIDAALKLPSADRLELLDCLWASLIDEGDAGSLSAAQLAELTRREDRLARTGPLGEDWEVVQRRLLARAAR